MLLSPSEIFYSQDSINNKFDKRCNHSYKYIGETLDDICEGRCSIGSIPTITVVQMNRKWFTADNRRLWVFKHLHRLGKCEQLNVNVGYSIPSDKFTTLNGGESIIVRRNPGGRWYLKPGVSRSRPSTVPSNTTDFGLSRYLTDLNLEANREPIFQPPTKSLRVRQSRHLVCGLDFGTTYSGWAYSFKDDYDKDPTEGYMKQWSSSTGLCTEKTPTVILIKPDGKTIKAFGYKAEEKYSMLFERNEHKKYFLFRQFKMALYKQLGEGITRHIELEDENGKTLPAIDVFSLAIKYLSLSLQKHLGNVSYVLSKTWVITVPAIWSDAAKQFMREAAMKTGIPSDDIKLVLEPEAASIYCRHLTTANIVNDVGIDDIKPPAGSKYIIFDAGGGTIDITLHKLGMSNDLREVKPASGADCGGTMVDREFEQLLVSIVGPTVYDRFKTTETDDYLELLREFELTKRQIGQTGGRNRISTRIPPSLCDIYQSMTNQSFREAIFESNEDITMVSDKLIIKGTSLTYMFNESIKRSIASLKEILNDEDLTQIHAIYMVGGYSQCPLLQLGLKEAFPTLNVVTPLDSGMCVLKGALIYGHNPEVISERVLRYTYGVRSRQTFDPSVHPISKLVQTEKGPHCSGIFSIHTKKGQAVHLGSKQEGHSYSATKKHQRTKHFPIYASDRVSPGFVDEPGCRMIGTVRMTLKKPFAKLYPSAMVYFTYSGPELIVEAVEDATGDKITATVNFLG